MRPVQFKGSNKRLKPSGTQYSRNVTGVEPLHVWTDSEQCVSRWKMSLRERVSALLFGRVWVALLSGGTQPPTSVSVDRSYFREGESNAL